MCVPKFLIWTICPKTKGRTSLGHMAPKKETECKRCCKLPKYGRSKVERQPYLGVLDSEMRSRVAYALYLSWEANLGHHMLYFVTYMVESQPLYLPI